MSRVTFILGAGASRDAGGPLMNDFLASAQRLYWDNQVPPSEREHFQRVFEAVGRLQAAHSKAQLDLSNVETVFSAFEMADLVSEAPREGAAVLPSHAQVLVSLKRLIVVTIECMMKLPISQRRITAHKSYLAFAELLGFIKNEAKPSHSVSVITFNYDVGLEVALAERGMPVDYRLTDNRRQGGAIPVLKLHGSLNWAIEEANGSIRPVLWDDYVREFHPVDPAAKLSTVPVGSQLAEYFRKTSGPEVRSEPLVVPPTWNKGDYHRTVAKVWKHAAEELSDARYVYVLGYSLPQTDSFFRLLYALGTIGPEPLAAFGVFNPDDSGEVEGRFQALVGTGAERCFEYVPMTFVKATHHIRQAFC